MTRNTGPDEHAPPSHHAHSDQAAANNRSTDHEIARSSSSENPGSAPAISFILLIIAVIAVGAGAFAWALVRPDHRTVQILIPTPGPVTVHVGGEVLNPGVYTLPPDSRVADAVDAAGGLTEQSPANLAALLRDGEQVVIRAASTVDESSRTDSTGQVTAPVPGQIDLNNATVEELLTLPNIGPTRAEAIVEFVTRNGPVLFVDDLIAIDGIGPTTVDSLRPLVVQP